MTPARRLGVLGIVGSGEDWSGAVDVERWRLTIASTLEAALEAAAQGDHDLCVVDMEHGVEVVREIVLAAEKARRRPPVIAVGSGAQQERDSVMLGAADFIARDQMRSSLLDRVLLHALQLRERELALDETRQRFALAIAGSSDGIWEWDRRSGMVFLSARWLAIMGLEEPEGVRPVSQWLGRVHDDDLACFQRVLDAHLEGAAPHFECEFRGRTGDGSFRWVRVRGVGERGAGGEVVRLSGSLTDIHAQKTSQLQYQHAALHDTLTGLPNRAFFTRQLRRVFRERVRSSTGGMFAVMFLDLDRFKLINDSLGHEAGDLLLTSLSTRLIPCVRAIDTIARIGGDEFSLLLENLSDESDALRVADQILRALEQPFLVEGHEVVTSCSIGIAFANRGYQHAENMLRDADNALFAAKGSGGAQYRVFSPDMHSRSVSLLRLESEMRRGIDAGEFELYYQPIVDLKTQRIASLEALARWNSPRRGRVSPADFIPIAEDTGLILGLGRWVLREACRFGSRLVEVLGAEQAPPINVNVSRRQLRAAFVDEVLDTMDAFPLARDIIRFEITESALMREGHDSGTLRAIRSMGIELHIDDFGTGYSSLASLASMEVSGLKIDRSFVERMEHDEKSELIVQTIVSLARSLHMRVTAEGIETQAQLKRLELLSCAFGQGYLFSRPMPGYEILQKLMVDQQREGAPVEAGEGARRLHTNGGAVKETPSD